MKPVVFSIDYPKNKKQLAQWMRIYSLNAIYAGKHWAARKKDSEFWHWLVEAALRKAKVSEKTFLFPVSVWILWNDRLDIDNHAYMGKMIVDALKGRLIPEDSRRFFVDVRHSFYSGDSILVMVKEIESESMNYEYFQKELRDNLEQI